MTDYTKATNFTSKDSLSTGNPLKIVKGTEIDTEFNNIQTAIATKADLASPTFSGSVTIVGGTITGITDLAVADGGTGASTAANARTNLSAASSGANSDITSITGLTTALAISQGGTGSTTLTANNVLLGNGTSAPQTVAPGTSGYVLTSNGTTWQSSSLPPALTGLGGQIFTSSGTFTVPTGVTAVKVTVCGGGGGNGYNTTGCGTAQSGGAGGTSIKYITGLSAGGTVAVTIGGGGAGRGATTGSGTSGNTSSFGAYCSATGGQGGSGSYNVGAALNGSGSGGDLNSSTGAGGGGWGWKSSATALSPQSSGAAPYVVYPNGTGGATTPSAYGGGSAADINSSGYAGIVVVEY